MVIAHKKNGNGRKPNTPTFLPEYKQYDLTLPENYEGDYPDGNFANNVEKIMEIPAIDDMPGVFLRGIFKNERSLNAHLRLFYRHKKFADTDHQELLRAKIAGSAAINGLARLDAIQAATNLIATDLYRVARGLPKVKKGEEDRVQRGSDFRSDQRPQQNMDGSMR